MDGGRRILRSLGQTTALPLVHFPAAEPQAAVAGGPIPSAASAANAVPPRAVPRRRAADLPVLDRFAFLGRPGVGLFGLALLFGGVGFAGMVQNGGYDALVAREGQPWDIAARAIGFDIAGVTITGQSRLTEKELLRAGGVDARNSLPFLDAAEVRERLMAIPLVKSARVMKLYPNRLVIAIEERRPHALWQQDGRITVVADDGVAIDELRDERYLGLPFVVGEGAQKRLPEFLQLMAGLGDLAQRVKAGVLVSGRRWDLDMTNGMLIKLPEENPARAVGTLLRLQREARILEKDVMSIDLRAPDRVAVRLTEEAAAAREAALPHKSKKTGG
ncbi:MAG: FtsQ-type POTRA domain-containing protein [Hyphomicrobiales bacterium]|nr:MAG: FtsQ-type POTRA domain-containing protein [Hyphomicrobiales bacterium]